MNPISDNFRTIIFLNAIIFVCFFFIQSTSVDPTSTTGLKIYVATNGNDDWSGKRKSPNIFKTNGPFASIKRARDEIRALKEKNLLPDGNIIVELKGGIYELSEALELETVDSGTKPGSRIIYRAENGEDVRLSGGKNISKWSLVSDPDVLVKFKPNIRGKIYQSDLSEIGITDYGTPAGGGIELFFNDTPMWISRYPNKGFVKITGIYNEDPVDIRGTKGDKVGKFNYEDPRINIWSEEKDPWVNGYWFWDWSSHRHSISKIDIEQRSIEVAPPYSSYGYRVGQWFYGYNLLSEIDEPGEYYLDRENGYLYFYPPSDLSKGQAYVSLNENLIRMQGVSSVTIQGMILEGCRGTVVELKDCSDVLVVGNTIRNSGDEAVTIDGGFRNGVTDCDIYGVGSGGIKIDAGDRKSLIPGECFAENNYIRDIARINRVYNPGISLNGVGNRATHNHIEHLPHFAIYFNGNEHLMEYNEINDVCYESNDAGAIYAGRNWTMRGNVIRYNYLHDISGFEEKGAVGVYLDDAFSGVEVMGNVFDKVSRAMMIGGGRDNQVVNNIFIKCIPSIHVDARGLGWMHDHPESWIKEAEDQGTILGIAFDQPPYSIQYPELINILHDEPKAPKGNVIKHNVSLGGVWDKASGFWKTSIELKARQYLTEMKDNIIAPNSEVRNSSSPHFIIADPLFVNPDNPKQENYQLKSQSPAIRLGFRQIPFDRMGLHQSENRASWPVSRD